MRTEPKGALDGALAQFTLLISGFSELHKGPKGSMAPIMVPRWRRASVRPAAEFANDVRPMRRQGCEPWRKANRVPRPRKTSGY